MTPCADGLIAAMVLINFLFVDHVSWSCSRVDTYSFQNFLGMIRQSSNGDDRFLRPIHIIIQAAVVIEAVMKLCFGSEHPG
jgi:hypothetical protein